MTKNNEKINEGCIKIFKLISLLYEDDATYENVIEIFKDELSDQSSNNLQVVLNKYLNTLKIFGIKVSKKNNKYKIDSSLYSMDYSMDDLKSISILINSYNNFPDEECNDNVQSLINNLILRMDNDDKNKLNELSQNYNFSFYFADLRQQIDECKKICKNNQKIEIFYIKKNKKITCLCQPKDVIYDSKMAYFQVFDINNHVQENIPLSNILSISTLHSVSGAQEVPTTVVYKVKNRLAKTYKIKPNEYSNGFDENGNQIIVNKNEPFEQLLSRLMKYSYNCEIISPKILRREMINLINETLKNYE